MTERPPKTTTFLAADVGGTKTLLGLFDEGLEPLVTRRYPTAEHASIEAMIAVFLSDAEVASHPRPRRAGLGVAGPVAEVDGGAARRAQLTNLPHALDTREIAAAGGFEHVALVNDFEVVAHAVAYALDHPAFAERLGLVALNPQGTPEPHGTLAVLGAGTGFGQATVVRKGPRPVVLPSEGGHVDLFARDAVERDVLRAYGERLGKRVSVERVLSGRGLVALYEIFRGLGLEAESPAVAAEMAAAEDRAAVVSRHGLERDDALSTLVLDRFVGYYGAHAGNVALTLYATGGVAIAGGIAPRILSALERGFLPHFVNKGRLGSVLRTIPVHVVTNPAVGLLGAAVVAAG
ncbi:MAG: glucokinase [Polyangiales bacterium]